MRQAVLDATVRSCEVPFCLTSEDPSTLHSSYHRAPFKHETNPHDIPYQARLYSPWPLRQQCRCVWVYNCVKYSRRPFSSTGGRIYCSPLAAAHCCSLTHSAGDLVRRLRAWRPWLNSSAMRLLMARCLQSWFCARRDYELEAFTRRVYSPFLQTSRRQSRQRSLEWGKVCVGAAFTGDSSAHARVSPLPPPCATMAA